MKLMAYVRDLRRRRARKRYEREKAARALQDEGAVDRVAENAARYMGGGGPGAT